MLLHYPLREGSEYIPCSQNAVMSAAQGTTVHDGLLHPHLSYCSSAASAVRRLPSTVRTATSAFDVRAPTRYQTTCQIRRVPLTVFAGTWKLFFSRFTTVHGALEALRYALHESTTDADIDIDIHRTAVRHRTNMYAVARTAGAAVWTHVVITRTRTTPSRRATSRRRHRVIDGSWVNAPTRNGIRCCCSRCRRRLGQLLLLLLVCGKRGVVYVRDDRQLIFPFPNSKSTGNESVPKITMKDTINLFF